MTLLKAALTTLLFLSAVQGSPLDSGLSGESSGPVAVGVPVLFNTDGALTGDAAFAASGKRDADAEAEAEAEANAAADIANAATLERRADPVAKNYIQAVIYHHNYHRANHSAGNLVWSDDLMVKARRIGNTCVYAHKMDQDGGGYGQNIAVGYAAYDVSKVISDLFYNGEVNYYRGMYGKEPDMTNFHNWGHFSQLVWKGTTAVGCATVDCRQRPGKLQNWSGSNAFFTVCNYSPPGNFLGRFAANIGAPRNYPTRTGTYQVDRASIAKTWWPGNAITK